MKFLLIDDHALFRHGLLLLLGRLAGEHVFLEADSCETALAQVAAHPDLDLVLLDLAMPGMHGLDLLVRLRAEHPATPVVLLSANENPRMVVDAMRRGAQGFIPKSASPEVMTAALQVVLAGGTYLPAQALTGAAVPAEGAAALTSRQREVLALLVQDRSNKEIAEALGMRVNTVRVHVAAILDVLGVDSRTEAARVALGQGWVSDVG